MALFSQEVILIKIGGSSITDKNTPFKLRHKIIIQLAKEIARVNNKKLLIAHGSGSFGHPMAAKFGGVRGYKNKLGIAEVFNASSEINEIVVRVLVKEGSPSVSVRPRGFLLAEEGKLKKHFLEVLENMLDQDLVPVMCGDVVIDRKWKTTIFSGEKCLNIIAKTLRRKKYKIKKIIQVGETAGFLNQEGETVDKITKKNWHAVKKGIFKVNRADVTGGILHKVEEALELSGYGIKTILIQDKPGNLYNAIMSGTVKGTVIG